MFQHVQQRLMSFIEPIATKLSGNQALSAISAGFMKVMPITIGLVAFSIIGNLPITGYTEWLTSMGIKESFDAALGASSNIISLYLTFTIAYSFTLKRNHNAVTAGLISLSSFILLMPQTTVVGEASASALSYTYLGSTGIIVALFLAIAVSYAYNFLCDAGVKFKMPDSVPSMVSESLEPIFIAIILFFFMIVLRIGFSFTSYGNIHTFISEMIAIPLLQIGTSIPALLFILFLGNVFWFFGIHPTTIQGPISPIIYMMLMDNIEKLQTGQPMLYVVPFTVYLVASLGANGNTLGLVVAMITAKSKRYRSMFKLAVIPHIFNINEPLIFGMPVMLNPIFFLPMTLNCVLSGLIAWVYLENVSFVYNPLMELLPWTTPVLLKYFFIGGTSFLILVLILLVVNTLAYYPFFKMADKAALLEEQALESQEKAG